ncbi:MAG: DUF4395 domain-containing protein [Spirochaetales bacterium]|jgi:hypothetical protein|nr:DUF4395 domain-containing protein [Spirochaetales bacterium]
MTIDLSCPISGNQRDNNTARLVAAQVLVLALVLVTLLFLGNATAALIIDALLALDFIIRAFAPPRYSPLATAGRVLSSLFRLKKVPVDSGPKIFAARIGVGFTAASAILLAFSMTLPAVILLGALALCAFLESLFGFCLGCWVYSLLPRGKKVRNP